MPIFSYRKKNINTVINRIKLQCLTLLVVPLVVSVFILLNHSLGTFFKYIFVVLSLNNICVTF